MDNKKLIGQRLNAALAMRDKKQKDLAAAIHVTDNTISYFCNGIRTPNLQQLVAISEELDVSTDFLLGKAQINNPTTDEKIRMISEYTGLSDTAVDMLNHVAADTKERSAQIMQAINLLLGEHFSNDFWLNLYDYLFTDGGDFNLIYGAGSTIRNIPKEQGLIPLLLLNYTFLSQLRKRIQEEGNGGVKNGKH